MCQYTLASKHYHPTSGEASGVGIMLSKILQILVAFINTSIKDFPEFRLQGQLFLPKNPMMRSNT